MGLTAVIFVNVVLSALVLGAIVGSHLWAIVGSRAAYPGVAVPGPAQSPAATRETAAIGQLVPEPISA